MRKENTITCTEVEEALPALALGALDENERDQVAAHLGICPTCGEQYVRYAQVSRGLLGAVVQRVPPPSIKAGLMARVQPRRRSLAEQAIEWLRGTAFAPRWALSVATAVVLITVVALGAQVVRLSNEQAALTQQLDQQQRVLATLAGSSTQVIMMKGTPVAEGASATLRFRPQDTYAVLQVRDLPTSAVNQSYQLWLVYADGKRDSGAVFQMPARAGGQLALLVVAPEPMKSYVRCGVSVEPRGGSPQPTGPAALTGKLWS